MHIMLDLETLSSSSDAAIISIGAVAFNFNNGIGSSFYAVLDTDEQVGRGRGISRSTMLWWGEQTLDAKKVFSEEASGTRDALQQFARFCDDVGNIEGMWGNGSDFDNVILGGLYDLYGMKKPWSYARNRCYRTLRNLPKITSMLVRLGTHHNARDDAIYQAECAIHINSLLNLGF